MFEKRVDLKGKVGEVGVQRNWYGGSRERKSPGGWCSQQGLEPKGEPIS